MKDNKKSLNFSLSSAILLILLVVSIVFVILVESGIFRTYKNNNVVKEYDNLTSAIQAISFNVDIPDIIKNEDNLEYRIVNNLILEVGNKNIVFKAAEFVDYRADVLALYNDAKTDKEFKITDNDIEYLRYRYEYDNMENCTIINIVKDKISYGIILNKVLNVSDILNMLNIKEKNMQEFNIEDSVEEQLDYNEVTIGNKFSIELPKFESSFNTIDMDGYTICYIDNTKVFVLVYDDYNIDKGTFSGQSEVTIDDNIVLRYISENPFENGSKAYNDYNNFIDTIDNIINSIHYP